MSQTAVKYLKIEVCICNDASTDNTENLLKIWKNKFEDHGIFFKVYTNEGNCPKGGKKSKIHQLLINYIKNLLF